MVIKCKVSQPCLVSHDESENVYFVRGGMQSQWDAAVVHADVVYMVNGDPFVQVGKGSVLFTRLVKSSIRGSNWIDQLEHLRNTACEELINKLRKEGGLEPMAAQSARRRPMMSRREAVADIVTPRTIEIEFPPDEEGQSPQTLTVVFEPTHVPLVQIPLRADALDFVVGNLRASGHTSSRGAKRTRTDEFSSKYKEVKWHNTRKQGYVDYIDQDGRYHRHHLKPDPAAENAEDAFDAMSEALHIYYQQHHSPPDSAGNDVLEDLDENDEVHDDEGTPVKGLDAVDDPFMNS